MSLILHIGCHVTQHTCADVACRPHFTDGDMEAQHVQLNLCIVQGPRGLVLDLGDLSEQGLCHLGDKGPGSLWGLQVE